ncbi:elongator complex protein 1 [Selaginella moellendorffii]|uniref:elongator complex protein 1 n=1 Tax=Selaginella moellendorffii TaxID=88036 RepID=UPI000D1D0E27|nr:elongator complex protein 1 [Selaginella moellendorffii]|eukprot:XP_002991968.2 elongator complex protein 1 [Selaginella moellendorffii]
MKNLEVLRERHSRLELGDEKIVAAAVDSGHDRAFFLSNGGNLHWEDELSRHSLSLASAIEFDAGVVGMEFLLELEALVIGMESGDLVLVEPRSSSAIEVIGSLQGGILSLAASPDGELLAIVSGLGQILLMTPANWDTVHEFSIKNNDRQEFSSSAVELSWRADGKYFATSEYNAQESSSVVKIWERETGKLHSSCEALPSTHRSSICWSPSGARIAASTSKADQAPSVTIFERNGLKKDYFQVTAPAGARVESLQWDSSGEVMKMVVRCDGWDAIQFWYCSNYHWYLKQEWRYTSKETVSTVWHPEKPLSAMVWTVLGNIKATTLGWKSAVLDSSVALVIDGPSLLVTPLAVCMTPPPLYFSKVRFPAPVNTVTLTSESSGFTTVAASLSDKSFGLAVLATSDGWNDLEDSEVVGYILQNFDGGVRNLISTGANRFCGLLDSSSGHGSLQFTEFEATDSGEGWTSRSLSLVYLDKPLIAAARSPLTESSQAFLQLNDGSILNHCAGELTPVGKFPVACPWMQAFEDKGQVQFVGLDERGQLHFRNSVISSECTGFALHITSTKARPSVVHLVYTTRQDLLHIIPLGSSNFTSSPPEVLDVGSGKRQPAPKDFNIQRVWERGARIVSTLGGSDVAVIMQPSRGNLETIYPRGLILHAVEAALAEQDFAEAITCARRHRIDLNVIVDFLGEKEFSRLAPDFVKQVGKLSLVTELVSCLGNENVLETTYKKTLSTLNPEDRMVPAVSSNKMQVVLEALRSAVENHVTDSPSREMCLLTILARNDPPLLEEALKRIKLLREGELGLGTSDDEEALEAIESQGKLVAESALKHLIWLADADAVFDAALGLYDLHLAAMVASHSQRDPKEFLPFLQELEDMPPSIMCYKIDCKLKRYASALRHLSSAGETYFNEALDHVQSHPELFSLALSIFTGESQRSSIMEAWGEYFLSQERFEDAAITFRSCSQLHKALAAYRAGGHWQGVLMVAGQLSMTPDEITNLALELREELQAMGQPKEAARVALDYCKDVKDAVGLLIEARDWMEVLRLCYLHAQPDIVDTIVQPAAVECANGLVGQFQEGVEKVGKYCARFVAVHQRRVLLEAKIKSDQGEDRFDDDTASEASSNLSGMSVYTRGTARTAATGRTRARRQGKVRAGSPGEELALVEHLKNMAISPQLADELRPLLQILVFVKREDLSCKLQQAASKFQATQAEAMRAVEENGITVDKTAANRVVNWSYQALERVL